MRKIILICIAVFSITGIKAQAPETANSAEIYLQLKKLNVLGSVLYIAAHPDDENTRLLAYLAKEKQYRTGYLSLTRGDGGQNLIGDEQGIELGLIRTQELLAARRIDGAEQFFSRAYDFGYSKTSEETLRFWDHDKILSDVVWVIRKFQPDVIITRFPGDERAGHGHHAASAILANEAFTAAADKSKFPEQFKYGVKPWQAKRILWNTFNFGSVNTTSDSQFKIDVGGYNSLLGKSIGEIASESRSQHKSQGFGVARQRGTAFEYFQLTGGDKLKETLMDGVLTDWKRLPAAAGVEQQINQVIRQYDFEHPQKSVPALVAIYQLIGKLPESYWRNQKLAEVQNIIMNCSGLFMSADSPDKYAIQGSDLQVQFFINKRNDGNITLKKISLSSFDTTLQTVLNTNANFTISKTFKVPLHQSLSQPYWLVNPLQKGSFDVSDQQLIGKAENDAAYMVKYVFAINGQDFTESVPVKYKYTDPVKGEVIEPLPVVPAITAHFREPVYIFDGEPQKMVDTEIKVKKDFKKVSLRLSASNGWQLTGGKLDSAIYANNTRKIRSAVTAPAQNDNTSLLKLDIDGILDAQGQQYNNPLLDEKNIAYEHIPSIIYFKPLHSKLEKLELKVKGKNVGYIVGAGDKVPQALQQAGYNVKLLYEADINSDNLKQFDAVITGIRAYNVHEFLPSKYGALMEYVHDGGNLIVQYNTNNNLSNIYSRIGPYPFNISRTRVSDETVPVKLRKPDSRALNFPNKITDKDFEGWVQERSIYQAQGFDSNFEAPLGMADPGEPESDGSLIIAKYGRGNFVYTGLVFFRELPAGVPGAYRLMANLIALPKN